MQLQDAVTGDGYDAQMQTNHLSHFLLTRLLMPALEVAAAVHGSARVVNHSSTSRNIPPTPLQIKYLQKGSSFGGSGIWTALERYHQSKLANMLFTSALQVYDSCSLRARQTCILFLKLDQQQARKNGKSCRHHARHGKRLGHVEAPSGAPAAVTRCAVCRTACKPPSPTCLLPCVSLALLQPISSQKSRAKAAAGA
jgi:hypothetical protein